MGEQLALEKDSEKFRLQHFRIVIQSCTTDNEIWVKLVRNETDCLQSKARMIWNALRASVVKYLIIVSEVGLLCQFGI